MKVAIDARMYRQSGVGRYIKNLIFWLEKLDKKNDYFILLGKKDFNTLKFNKNFNKVLADFSWYGIKEQWELPKILNRLNVDLVHFPHFNTPIFYNKKFVVTIHDLIHQHFQMKRVTTHGPFIYKIKQFGYGKIFGSAVSKSQKIITVSGFVKNQLQKNWPKSRGKILVTPEAVDDKILSIVKFLYGVKQEQILKKLNVKQPFIFYIGNAHPHKNIKGLIKAFLKLRKNYQYLTLVLAGGEHYFWEQIKKEFQDKDVKYVGHISDEQMVALYKSAKVFVLPSFEEGFGIPVLEAMACSCPVAASNVASIPEVGGKAAVYFNPKDIEDMAEKITLVLNNEKLRKDLINKGLKRYKIFSWEKLAGQTLEVYERCG